MVLLSFGSACLHSLFNSHPEACEMPRCCWWLSVIAPLEAVCQGRNLLIKIRSKDLGGKTSVPPADEIAQSTKLWGQAPGSCGCFEGGLLPLAHRVPKGCHPTVVLSWPSCCCHLEKGSQSVNAAAWEGRDDRCWWKGSAFMGEVRAESWSWSLLAEEDGGLRVSFRGG